MTRAIGLHICFFEIGNYQRLCFVSDDLFIQKEKAVSAATILSLTNKTRNNELFSRKSELRFRLREAVRQADEKHKETGERYYVMPAGGKKGQLIIMDRKNFRKLKQKGYINHNTFVGDLERECFYCTTYGNGSAMLPSAVIALKRKQYFSWLDSFSNTKENGKVRKH